jgi:hypothetical protein
MGLHDRDYYREELRRRDGRRPLVLRYWVGGWRTAKGWFARLFGFR